MVVGIISNLDITIYHCLFFSGGRCICGYVYVGGTSFGTHTRLMKQIISCSTCKHSKTNSGGIKCPYSFTGCLKRPGRTDLPEISKRNDRYHYFKWVPIWDYFPEDLFEI